MYKSAVHGFKFAIAFIFLLFGFGCAKDSDVESKVYNFENTLTVSAESDVVSVGDTVWFESKVQGFLKDSATSKNIHFRQANIYMNVAVRSWSEQNSNNDIANFNFIYDTYVETRTNVKNASVIGFYYLNKDGVYVLKCGVSFNTSGIFSIDTDYLVLNNFFSENSYYLGGGNVEMEDINGNYQVGYLNCSIDVPERNMEYYNELSDTEQKYFAKIDETNMSKYYFIKVD